MPRGESVRNGLNLIWMNEWMRQWHWYVIVGLDSKTEYGNWEGGRGDREAKEVPSTNQPTTINNRQLARLILFFFFWIYLHVHQSMCAYLINYIHLKYLPLLVLLLFVFGSNQSDLIHPVYMHAPHVLSKFKWES